jgi:hypothetical protein
VKENTKVGVKGHIKIFDPNTGEVFVEKNNAINFEAMSMALAYSLGNQGTGFIARMVFGNGGSSIDATGLITYLPPKVTGTNAGLYSKTYPITPEPEPLLTTLVNHTSNNLYSDLVISCTIPFNAPSTQAAFDNDVSLNSSFTFDELGLEVDIPANSPMLISHVVFHPVQKSLNREIQIDYTIRIQALTNLMSI